MDIAEPKELKTYSEAVGDSVYGKQWRKATQEELQSLGVNRTWHFDDLPPSRKTVSSKWVFKVKKNWNGNIERFKARVVARRFTQEIWYRL